MKIHKMFGNKLNRTKYGVDDTLVDSESFLGVELELEGLSGTAFMRYLDNYFWIVKGDGSLRNGCELVFKKPLKGANITEALADLDSCIAALRDKGTVPELSIRTSMHVHLDVRDLEQEEVEALITLYMLFERLLFRYVGSYRIKNNYCRALVDSTFNSILERLRKTSSSNSYLSIVSEMCDKYSALNVKAISTFGSLEFRHHPGSYKSEEIVPWCNLILSLKAWIKQGNTVESLMPLTAEEAIIEVFKDVAGLLLSQPPEESYSPNKGAVLKILNYSALSRETSRILSRTSKAKNSLINQYAGAL